MPCRCWFSSLLAASRARCSVTLALLSGISQWKASCSPTYSWSSLTVKPWSAIAWATTTRAWVRREAAVAASSVAASSLAILLVSRATMVRRLWGSSSLASLLLSPPGTVVASGGLAFGCCCRCPCCSASRLLLVVRGALSPNLGLLPGAVVPPLVLSGGLAPVLLRAASMAHLRTAFAAASAAASAPVLLLCSLATSRVASVTGSGAVGGRTCSGSTGSLALHPVQPNCRQLILEHLGLRWASRPSYASWCW